MKSIVVENLSKVYRVDTRVQRQEADGPVQRALRRMWLGSGTVRATREVWALRDISLEVEPGTVLGVIGRNGAGKTSLLKTLGRVTVPTSGRAVVRGRIVSLLGLGHGFQRELSARDNIYLNAALYGIGKREVDRRLPDILEFAGIHSFVDSPVGQLSSGMYLRLAFAVAVNMNPDIILADEVLAVGDIEFQERCLQRVEQAGRQGLTVLFVSHDMRAIRRLCHRVLRLDAGQLVDEGPAEDVVDRYEAEAFGDPTYRRWRGAKFSPHLRFRGLRLTSPDGQEIDAPRALEDFLIRTEFRTLVPDLQLRLTLTLSTGDVVVLESGMVPPFVAPTPGIWIAALKIPGGLLADRVYTAEVTVGVVENGEIVGVHKNNQIAFQVYGGMDLGHLDIGTAARGKSRRPVVAPQLDWTLTTRARRVAV
jgi:lipopolysaccharide transport system ATP-binding protein